MMISDYIQRRRMLREQIGSGIILLFGNHLVPMNYPANPLPFRQDSNFLYFTGIDKPGLALLIDCDKRKEILFGNNPSVDDIIWSGPQPSMNDLAVKAGVNTELPFSKLKNFLNIAINKKRAIHYLPPYPAGRKILIASLLKKPISEIEQASSEMLIQAVIQQRSFKSAREVSEIENALEITREIHIDILKNAVPGNYESHLMANMNATASRHNTSFAYPVICSVHGETLHNVHYLNKLKKGQILLVDAGVESNLHYASDITRTYPVGGKFSQKQKEIYELVLSAQLQCIAKIKPGINYLDLHIEAAVIIAQGLKNLGLMTGNAQEAVNAGAHALFFPHGLGHMLGLDVHDMEDLGENFVGYSDKIKRNPQFGIAFLRMARTLHPGFVVTVEPGIYFIPELISLWNKERKFKEYLNYSKIENYLNFGGIRIEDNVLVTNSGARVLGKPIPKAVDEIELQQ